MPRPKKIKPIKRQVEFDMNLPVMEKRSPQRHIAKSILREALVAEAIKSMGGKAGETSVVRNLVEGRDYPEIMLSQDERGYITRPKLSEPANYKSGGMYAKKKKKPMYEMGGKAADMIMKMMKGGMMPKYPGGGMIKYENGGEVDPDSPEFKEYLEYRMRGSGQPLYFEEYKGEQLSPTELREMIRKQGSGMAIPRSLMPENVSDRYMNEAMIGYSSGPGGARATMADAMSGAEAMFNQNRKFEQEFLEYMKGKGGAAPRREPGMRLEQTPEGELTNAERRLLASFNR
tara:strand:- start:203 stop:1066 length:864 start_codon:yes stop_codon:yes gene_type:complete